MWCVRCVGVGVKLDKEDLCRIAELWDTVINPACIKWGQETGKPAEAYREAVVGVVERHTTKFNPWNAWQRVWWCEMPVIEDEGVEGKSILGFCLCVLTTPCSGAPQGLSGAISRKARDIGGRRTETMDEKA